MFFALLLIFIFSHSSLVIDSSQCASNTYFYPPTLSCITCPSNSVYNKLNNNCECFDGYYPSAYSTTNPNLITTCTACGTSTIYGKCFAFDSTKVEVNQVTGKFQCKSTYSGYRLLFETLPPTYIVTCIRCPEGTYALTGSYECIYCPYSDQYYDTSTSATTKKCTCTNSSKSLNGRFCVTSEQGSQINSFGSIASSLSFNNLETENNLNYGSLSYISQLMKDYYELSVAECIYGVNVTACNILANLCVLTQYNEKHPTCSAFKFLQDKQPQNQWDPSIKDINYKQNIPWLFYNSVGYDNIKNNLLVGVTLDVNATNLISNLRLILAKYTFNGTFLGFQDMTTELQFCPTSNSAENQGYSKVGSSFQLICKINLTIFLNYSSPLFYEVFLQTEEGKIYDVPILITSFLDISNYNPNVGKINSSSTYRFVRRFHAYDTITAKNNGEDIFDRNNLPNYIGYIYRSWLHMELVNTKTINEKSYRPYIKIEYAERNINSDLKQSYTVAQTIQRSNYWMSYSAIYTTAAVFLYILLALSFILAIFKFYLWTCVNPSQYYGENYFFAVFIQFVYLQCDTFSNIFFWFLFGCSTYYWCFLKMQKRAYIMQPNFDDEIYREFTTTYIVTTSLKFTAILFSMIFQSTFDVFFIDWEKPKVKLEKDHQVQIVNCWRSIFVCNELNELQNSRNINFELCYMVYLFFMFFIGWFDSAQGTATLTYVDHAPICRFLYLFLLVCVFMGTGVIQYILKTLFSNWIGLPSQVFIDLCSICNISIIFFDSLLHGYYIHGQSPGGISDTSLAEIKFHLENESRGDGRYRGLEASTQSNLQTYEIFIPASLRARYDGYFRLPIQRELDNAIRQGRDPTKTTLPGFRDTVPSGIDISTIEKRRKHLCDTLKIYIENLIANNNKYIFGKSLFYKITRLPPEDPSTLDYPLFLRDPRMNFTSLFLESLDLDFLQFDVLVMWFWIIISKNFFFAVFMTYILDEIMLFIRRWFCERNVASKTLIDQKFLT